MKNHRYFFKLFFINLLCLSFSNLCNQNNYVKPITHHKTSTGQLIKVQRTKSWNDLQNSMRYVLVAISLRPLKPFAAIQAEELLPTTTNFKGLSYVQAHYQENLRNLSLDEVQSIDENRRILVVKNKTWKYQPTLEKMIEQYHKDQKVKLKQQRQALKPQSKL